MEQTFWTRDLLPQFLWIDSLVYRYGEPAASSIFGDFLSAADQFNTSDKNILDGSIGAFQLIPEDRRSGFVEALRDKISFAIAEPFGNVLSLYPECPMYWMIAGEFDAREDAVSKVRSALERLTPGKDDRAGLCRVLPLTRLFAHDKLFISDHLTELVDAIRSYPKGDRYRVEAFARSVHNSMMIGKEQEGPDILSWSRSFWRTNRNLVPCRYGQ